LRLWLSAPSFDHIRKLHGIRKPKIWMLTGIYRLEGASVFCLESRSRTAAVGVSSVTIGALVGMPIGGGFEVGPEHSLRVREELRGPHVWAARYRRLDIDYIRITEHDPMPALSKTISLFPNILSAGHLRNPGEYPNAASVHLHDAESVQMLEPCEDAGSSEEYNKALEEAMALLEEYLAD